MELGISRQLKGLTILHSRGKNYDGMIVKTSINCAKTHATINPAERMLSYYYYYYYYYRIYIALFHKMVKALTLGRDKLA